MNTPFTFVSAASVERLGWVLIHSVWQFLVIAVAAALATRWLRQASSESRSAALFTCLLAMVAFPLGTWFVLDDVTSREMERETPVALRDGPEPVLEPRLRAPAMLEPVEIATETALPTIDEGASNERGRAWQPAWLQNWHQAYEVWHRWLVVAWVLGVVLGALRPMLGWRTLRRLRSRQTAPVADELQAALDRAHRRLGLQRQVRVLSSGLARVPLVVGYLRPVILLPASLLTTIPLSQLEAILMHELAHVRRHDFVVNLLQVVMETLFFYHPAVWWLSHRIRVEREHCCDDLVVQVMQNRSDYGRALIAIEELRGQPSVFALGAVDGSLLARVRRIAEPDREPRSPSACAGVSLLACLLGIWLATAFLPGDELVAMESTPEPAWGDASDGLRIRVVPVRTTMNETQVDMQALQRKFEAQKEIAFAVEMENVSDRAIKILDTGYGDSFGKSSGKPNTNWFGQFLFSIEYFDADGKKVGYPEVTHVSSDLVLGSTKQLALAAGQKHRFLIRPSQWRNIHYQRLRHRRYTAVVHYHGISQIASNRIRERDPDDDVLEVWSGDVASRPTSFQIARPKLPPTQLGWGEPVNGLRVAMSFANPLPWYGFGDKLDLLLHVQNVSDQPITLASEMWLSYPKLSIIDKDGNPIKSGATVTRGGLTPMCRTTLQPGQEIRIGAGNLGVAKTKQQADAFDYLSLGAIVVPAGEYRLFLEFDSRYVPRMEDGKGKQLAPLDGDYEGQLKTDRKYLFLKERAYDMDAKEVNNASTPLQWADLYVEHVSDRRHADGSYPASAFAPLRAELRSELQKILDRKHTPEPGAEAWQQAIDARATWSPEAFHQHVLELAEWQFHVIANSYYKDVEKGKYPRDIPRPGRTPRPGELAQLPFGAAAKNGLRAAWVVESRPQVRVGETVRGRFVFHNSGTKPVRFSVEPWGWSTWTARHADSSDAKVQHIPLAYWLGTYVRYELQPGQVSETVGEPLGFGDVSRVNHALATTWVAAKAGDVVTIGGEVRLGRARGEDHKPHADEFVDPLPISERKFTVLEGTPDTLVHRRKPKHRNDQDATTLAPAADATD